VVPEQESFTIQVLTPDFVLEMDFADADKVLKALGLFETKKVLEVDFDEPSSVRSQITRYRKRCFWSRGRYRFSGSCMGKQGCQRRYNRCLGWGR
jgi:hypothetical protein